MESAVRFRALAGTFDFSDGTISFALLPVTHKNASEYFVIDGNEVLPVSEVDAPGSDCAIAILVPGEIVTDEMKAELEERLRLRLAHFNLCHPNIPLKQNHLRREVLPRWGRSPKRSAAITSGGTTRRAKRTG